MDRLGRRSRRGFPTSVGMSLLGSGGGGGSEEEEGLEAEWWWWWWWCLVGGEIEKGVDEVVGGG